MAYITIDNLPEASTVNDTDNIIVSQAGVTKRAKRNLVTPFIMPSGVMTPYAGASAPTGWLLCDGAAYSTAVYPALFSAIGYTFGGSGANFNVPDMRGASPAGAGTSTGYTQNQTVVLGAKINDQMQGHEHRIYGTTGPSGAVSSLPTIPVGPSLQNNQYDTGSVAVSIRADSSNGTPRTGNVTHGKLVGVNFIIKV